MVFISTILLHLHDKRRQTRDKQAWRHYLQLFMISISHCYHIFRQRPHFISLPADTSTSLCLLLFGAGQLYFAKLTHGAVPDQALPVFLQIEHTLFGQRDQIAKLHRP